MVEKLDRTLEQGNEQPETKKETEKLKTKLKASTAAALLALTVSVSGIEQNDNVNTQIPGSEVLEEVERKGVGDRISEGIKSMLAKGVNFVIPPAHAWDDIAEDDSRGEDDWKEARDSYQETREERKQAEERAQQAQEEAREVESTRIEYVREIKGLVNILGVDFANTGLEEKRNFLKEKGVQRDLTEEESQRILDYTGDISAYIEANY